MIIGTWSEFKVHFKRMYVRDCGEENLWTDLHQNTQAEKKHITIGICARAIGGRLVKKHWCPSMISRNGIFSTRNWETSIIVGKHRRMRIKWTLRTLRFTRRWRATTILDHFYQFYMFFVFYYTEIHRCTK